MKYIITVICALTFVLFPEMVNSYPSTSFTLTQGTVHRNHHRLVVKNLSSEKLFDVRYQCTHVGAKIYGSKKAGIPDRVYFYTQKWPRRVGKKAFYLKSNRKRKVRLYWWASVVKISCWIKITAGGTAKSYQFSRSVNPRHRQRVTRQLRVISDWFRSKATAPLRFRRKN